MSTVRELLSPRIAQRRLISVKRPVDPATPPITTVKPTETSVCGSVASAQIKMIALGRAVSGTRNGTRPVST